MKIKPKPITPYQRLFNEFSEFCGSIKWPQAKDMFFIPRAKILDGVTYDLRDVYERTAAAKTLGYEVVLEADNEEGLKIIYRKKPTLPWQFK